MISLRSRLASIAFIFLLVACSTQVINLTDTGSILHTTRSLAVRESEAERVLIMDLNSLPLRPEDIARFEAILINPNTVVFTPDEPLNPEDRPALISLGPIQTPQLAPDEQNLSSAATTPATRRIETTDEARVRALERQAAIRLLSQNPDSFLLILAQLSDQFENVRAEALKVVLAADASYEPDVWRILQSGRLDSATRTQLIPFFLNAGARGVARLMILLADQDEPVRYASAGILVEIFPSPTNPSLYALVHSPNASNRALAPLWLITYRTEPALRLLFTLIDDPHPTVVAAARSAYSIDQVQEWAAIPSLAYLRLPFSPASRALIISRLIAIGHPLVIPYVYELLDHPSVALQQQSFAFAVLLGNAYHPELIRLVHAPETSPFALVQVIRLINLRNNNQLRQHILPLLEHPDEAVRQTTQTVITENFNDFATALNLLFDPPKTSLSTLFIAHLFMHNVHTALLFSPNSTDLSYQRLRFLWQNLNPEVWRTFMAALPRSRNRVEITLLYTFYQTVQNSSWLNISHPNQLIALSTALTVNALKIQEASRRNPALLSALIADQQALQRQWQNTQLAASSESRDLFARHALTIQQLNDSFLGLPVSQTTLANQFLAQLNLSTAFLKEFTALNLRA